MANYTVINEDYTTEEFNQFDLAYNFADTLKGYTPSEEELNYFFED
jgi:hypothetical protein